MCLTIHLNRYIVHCTADMVATSVARCNAAHSSQQKAVSKVSRKNAMRECSVPAVKATQCKGLLAIVRRSCLAISRWLLVRLLMLRLLLLRLLLLGLLLLDSSTRGAQQDKPR